MKSTESMDIMNNTINTDTSATKSADRTKMRSALLPAIGRTHPVGSESRRIVLKRPAEQQQIKRALIISASYTPLLNPRAFRWSSIAEQWSAKRVLVDVISAGAPNVSGVDIHKGVRVFRSNSGVVERLREKFRPSSRTTVALADVSTEVSKESIIVSLLKSMVRRVHDLVWKNLYWPDYACLWYFPALKQAEALLKERRYDTVITVSDPFTAHLVGRTLKKKYPDLNWLVDIGDPFSFRYDNPTNNFDLYEKFNHRNERDVFIKADRVTVTSEATRDRYAELFAESADKISVVGPLAPDVVKSIDGQSLLDDNGKYKLVFAGTLYRNIRNPHYLLQMYESLLVGDMRDKFELHFLGGFDDCKSYFAPYNDELGKTLFLHGLVPREAALKTLGAADILINIGNENPYQLPSKIVEYAALGKPIVQLSAIENDSSHGFLKSYPNVLIVDSADSSDANMVQLQVQQLEEFIKNSHQTISPSVISAAIKPFTIQNISQEYINTASSSIRSTKENLRK